MAQNKWSQGARKARGVSFVTKGISAVILAAIAYTGTISAAQNPDIETIANVVAPQIRASLIYSGTDVMITGSVAHMFDAQTFSGPNRSEKRARNRPIEDALTIARSFEEVRMRLAALRNDSAPPAGGLQSGFANTSPAGQAPRISVAAIDPALISAALDAIDTLDKSKDGLPAPIHASERLAYARANTPATVFKTPVSMKVSQKQLWCLASAVYFEARGESYRGQVSVAQVVMNRVHHKLYPKTICGVVFQNQSRRNACQFSFACDGIPERVRDQKSWAQAKEIAEKVTGGSLYLTEVANATHYHANYVYPRWAPRMKRVAKVGLHIFYRFKRG